MYILLYRRSDEPAILVFPNKDRLIDWLDECTIDIDYYESSLVDGDIDFDKFPCNTAYLIKGELILPKIKEVVTQYEVE